MTSEPKVPLSNHADPYVRRVVNHMIELYREYGCPLLGEEAPFEPIWDSDCSDERAIEIVYEAFDEMVRMGILAPNREECDKRPGPNFPIGWICPDCAMNEQIQA